MYTEWTKHLRDTEEKQKFLGEVRGAKSVLDFQKKWLDEKEKVLNRSEINPTNYNIANWSEFQAHKNGYRQALYEFRTFIDLDQQKE